MRLSLIELTLLGFVLVAPLPLLQAFTPGLPADALCTTDTECAELCPEGTRDLPADHPDYCDGGPQS